jgi:hypothetical protein
MKRRALLIAGLAVLSAGCGSRGADHFPLGEGVVWTYSVRDGFKTYVEKVRVGRSVSVSGTAGWEVGGPLGLSRMAWKEGVLVADTMTNVRFQPDLPLLVPAETQAVRDWRGRITCFGSTEEGIATLTQEAGTEVVSGRKEKVLRSTIVIESPQRTTKVVTAYLPGRGVLRQEQWTNGEFDVALELLSGP